MNKKLKKLFLPILIVVLALILSGCGDEGITVPVSVPVRGVPEISPIPTPIIFAPQALERIGTRCTNPDRNCLEAWNGTKLVGYSNDGVAETWRIDSTTGKPTFLGETDLSGGITSTVGLVTFTEGIIVSPTHQAITTTVAATIRGYLGSTVNVLEVQSYDQTTRFAVSPGGQVTVTGDITTGGLTVDTTTLVVDSTNNRVGVGTNEPATDVEIRTSDAAAELRLWAHDDSVGGSDVYIQLGHKVNGANPDNEWYMGLDASDKSFSIGYGAGAWGIPGDANVLTFPIDGSAHLNNSLQVTNSITATTWVSVGTFLKLSAPVLEQTITDGTEDIAPAGSYHEIGAGGSVANTMKVSGYSQGDYVMIVNVTAQTITITDTGTTKLASSYGMTVDDSLTLLFDGTNWVEIARSVN